MDIVVFKAELYGCRGVVYDLDRTLVDGRVAEGVGKRFLKSELKRGHLGHVWLGVKNYGEVQRRAREQGEYAGLEHFIDVIAQTGCATYQMFHGNAYRYIREHMLPGTMELMEYLRNEVGPSFISTLGIDLSARAFPQRFVDDTVGNRLKFSYGGGDSFVVDGFAPGRDDSTAIRSIAPVMRNGREKVEVTELMLQRHGLIANRCLVVGDDVNDHALMRASQLSAASPLADDDTKRVADIWIPDYRTFLEELKAA